MLHSQSSFFTFPPSLKSLTIETISAELYDHLSRSKVESDVNTWTDSDNAETINVFLIDQF